MTIDQKNKFSESLKTLGGTLIACFDEDVEKATEVSNHLIQAITTDPNFLKSIFEPENLKAILELITELKTKKFSIFDLITKVMALKDKLKF